MPKAAAQEDDLLAQQREWINKSRGHLMLAAAFPASATFHAGLNAAHQRVAMFPASYAWFTIFNSMAMWTSVIIILLLSSERSYRTHARIATLRLIAFLDGAFLVAAGAFGTFPEDPLRFFLGPVVVCLLVLICVVVFGRR